MRRVGILLLLVAACGGSEEVTQQPATATSTPTATQPVDSAPVDVAVDVDVAVADPPACTPWTWQKHGAALSPPSSTAQNDGFLSPAVAERQGTIHLWFASKVGLTYRLQHASSTDGVTFTAPEPLTGLREAEIVAYPAVLVDGGKFRLWYGSGSFDYAESDDGVHFTNIAERVFTAGATGSFDAMAVLYPAVVNTPAGLVLYYTGFNGQAYAIGRAIIGQTIDRAPAAAVITVGKASDFDNKAVAQTAAVIEDGEHLAWYGAYDTRKTNPGPYRIGFAKSADGIAWQKQGIAIDLDPAGHDAYSARDPAVLRREKDWLMIYVGFAKDRRYRLLRATSEICAR